jgi:hypothetical protein
MMLFSGASRSLQRLKETAQSFLFSHPAISHLSAFHLAFASFFFLQPVKRL